MARSKSPLAAAGAILCLLAGASAARAAGNLPYSVSIETGNSSLKARFEQVSRLLEAKDNPPPGLAGLDQRAAGDKTNFEDVLRSEGYYDGAVTIAIDDSTSPVQVTMKIVPGKRYTLGACKIVYSAPAPKAAPQACGTIGLKEGQPAAAEPIIAATKALIQTLHEHGRPDAKIAERRAIVNHLTHLMRLTFNVDPGREAFFGKVLVSGPERTDHAFLSRIVPWKEGAEYDVRKLEDYRQRLANLNLFDTLSVKPDTAKENAKGIAPIMVDAHERPHHSIGLGIKYATDTGPGGKATWEDRNLWGHAEDLKLSFELGTLGQSIDASLTLPHEPNTDQTLGFSVTTERATTDAYDLNGLIGLAQITTPLGGHWAGKGGIGFEAADVKQSGSSNFSILASVPVGVTYDSTNSLLNPQKGARLALQARPVIGTSGGIRSFLIFETTASAYRPLDDAKKLIAAARLRLGTILFSPLGGVPADLRFYAGGGGSVRGFGYQQVGPHDASNVPTGGRSVADSSLELRYRAWNDIGIVGFVDAGTVAESPYFSDAQTPRIGAGLGVRYYTGFGPLRLDVGVPVNPRPGDAPVQLYVSLGQAF